MITGNANGGMTPHRTDIKGGRARSAPVNEKEGDVSKRRLIGDIESILTLWSLGGEAGGVAPQQEVEALCERRGTRGPAANGGEMNGLT